MLVLIQSSTSNKKEAKKIAKILLKKKLAACVQISKINSLYTWQNSLNEEKEFLLSIKSTRKKINKIFKLIKKIHSYDLPEFVVFKIDKSSKKYKKWLLNLC